MACRHALFPGTFDPPTLGHLDLVRRALALFGRVTVGVADHPSKRPLFDGGERVSMLRAMCAGLGGVAVERLRGLVVDGCRELGAEVIVRGVRSSTDFDYEVQMSRTNRDLEPELDTVLLSPAPQFAHLSSTLVRQIAALGGDVKPFVPVAVATALRERFGAVS